MKKFMIALAAIAVGLAAHASAMYWQVSNVNEAGTNISEEWAYARIEVLENGQATGTYLQTWDGESWASGIQYVDKTADGAWFDVSSYEGAAYSFVLELVNADLQLLGSSEPASYSELAKDGVITSSFDSIAPESYTVWNQGFVSIPEPTGGMLLLMGTALLALRRKQK